ncbi:hypothetical protein ACJMQP_25485 [Rhodopseudomonas palustris]
MAPYLLLDDVRKLGAVRSALRRGDLVGATKTAAFSTKADLDLIIDEPTSRSAASSHPIRSS